MIISSRAWHLRLVRWVDAGYYPHSLCTHFWAVMGVLAVTPVGGIAIAVLIVAAIPVIVGVWLREHRPHKKREAATVKEPSLVIEWLKAKKRRVCPLITVKEPI